MSEAIISRRGSNTSVKVKETLKTELLRVNQTYTIPLAKNNQFTVRIFGGGGGGNYGGGGGSGQMNNGVLTIARNTKVAITIGKGGGNGIAGGTTSFGTYLSAPGGSGATQRYGGSGGAGGGGYNRGGKGYQFGGGGGGGAGGIWGGGGGASGYYEGGGGAGGTYGGGGGATTDGRSISHGGNGGTYGGGGGASANIETNFYWSNRNGIRNIALIYRNCGNYGIGGQYGGNGSNHLAVVVKYNLGSGKYVGTAILNNATSSKGENGTNTMGISSVPANCRGNGISLGWTGNQLLSFLPSDYNNTMVYITSTGFSGGGGYGGPSGTVGYIQRSNSMVYGAGGGGYGGNGSDSDYNSPGGGGGYGLTGYGSGGGGYNAIRGNDGMDGICIIQYYT